MRKIRLTLLIAVAVLAVALAVLHLRFPLPYVFTVVTVQGPDYDDIYQFPSSSISASASPDELPVAIDPRVAAVVEQHPEVSQLQTLLEETETTAFLVVHDGRLVEERYLRATIARASRTPSRSPSPSSPPSSGSPRATA